MQKQITWWAILFLLCVVLVIPAQAQNKKESSVTITILDAGNGEPMPGAICTIDEIGIFGMANVHGVVVLPNIPEGRWKIKTTLLGFKTEEKTVVVQKNLRLIIRLKEESLSLDEVVVTAKRKTAGGTTEQIGRQAMDHIQATTLGDVMQLLPGGLLPQNKDFTSTEEINIRSVAADVNNAYGVSVIMDGMPINDAAAISSLKGLSAGVVDMRQIPTDNVESVEVVTGVPSAEYGEMTAGAVIVHTKAGTTPLSARVKITPSALQSSIGKGFALPKNWGILNASFDYVNSSGDPRKRTEAFDRVSANLAWSKKIGSWSPNVRLAYSGIVDQSKNDPDKMVQGNKDKTENFNFRFSHDGRLAINKWYSRSLKYTIGADLSKRDYYSKNLVSTGSSGRVLFNSTEDGIHLGDILPSSYWATGGSKGESFNAYAKVNNDIFVKTGLVSQRFKMGVEYRYSKNYGEGKYNDNDALPLSISDSRPRRYIDIPGLTTMSAYLEDNMKINWKPMPIDFSAGVRAQVSQPGKEESVSSVSPRLNLSMKPLKWLNVRLAYGLNAKSPGLTYLYPDYNYYDKVVATYSDGSQQYTYYQTYKLKPDNSKLKNSITRRLEGGFDIKLWKGASFYVTGYIDRNTNGFNNTTVYQNYLFNYYSLDNGSIQPQPAGAPIIDWNNPSDSRVAKLSAGMASNNAASENKGVEFNLNLGKVEAISTSFYVRGAWQRTERWTKGCSLSTPNDYVGDSSYSPIKFVYNNGVVDIDERFSNQVQAVCHIPKLQMVASLSGQMIWYTHSKSDKAELRPLGYLDSDLQYHDITPEMYDDPDYTIEGFNLQRQISSSSDQRGKWDKPLWVMNARLTKNISKFLQCSFYANNVNYYQPWASNNISTTKIERNKNNFSFGVELSLHL